MPVPDDLPKSRSGRVPRWVVEERLGRGAAPDATRFRPPQRPLAYLDERPEGVRPAVTRPRPRIRRWPWVVVLVLAAAIVWAGAPQATRAGRSLGLVGPPGSSATPAWTGAAPSDAPQVTGRGDLAIDVPPPGVGERRTRLLPAVVVARPSRAWRPARTQQDVGNGDAATPVRWDPCRPITYVVNPAGAPRGGAQLVATAVAEVEKATGLRFVAAGTTTERLDPKRAPYLPTRYPGRWAPVLVGWGDPTTYRDPATGIEGRSLTTGSTVQGRPAVNVSGVVELDAPAVTQYLSDPSTRPYALAEVRYHLATLVGLGVVDDPTQLMSGHFTPTVTTFAAGDRTGLAELGKGPCAPWL